mmetsp:Transcript_14595/g.39790  ORF Transcript_14595/g.39790 Transcript_14595/m.39790 type:complete len:113 (+) Transcript_14595:147-485(+)
MGVTTAFASALIVVGPCVILLAAIFGVWWCCKRKNSNDEVTINDFNANPPIIEDKVIVEVKSEKTVTPTSKISDDIVQEDFREEDDPEQLDQVESPPLFLTISRSKFCSAVQ